MGTNSRPKWPAGARGKPVSARSLASLLGKWSSGSGPLYAQLAFRIRSAIQQGDLPPATRLPPERLLAQALAVSRTTVVAAYDELREQALLESRQGSGTWVCVPDAAPSALHFLPPAPRHTVLSGLMGGSPATLELLGAHLPGIDGVFTGALQAAQDDIVALTTEAGYFPTGLPALRRAIAQSWTRSGLPCQEEQILVTTGAQQAIGLTAAVTLRPGDSVVVEDPTYVGAIDAFRLAGARLVPLAVGPEGVSAAALREAVGRSAARLVYLMPTYQNPTGAVMSDARRREIARVLDELQVPTIEDQTLADIVLSGSPPPPLAAFTKRAPVLTIGSMSKLYWAGLRVGWVRAPESLLAPLIHQKVVSDMASSVPAQCIAARLLSEGDKVQRMRRQQVGAALDLLTELLVRHLPGSTFMRPKGGLVVWLRLPEGDANELAQVALRHGVSIVPGSLVSPEGAFSDHVRIPIEVNKQVLEQAVERLGRAWQAYRKNGRRARAVGVLV